MHILTAYFRQNDNVFFQGPPGAMKLPGGTGHPQMRSRLLQQLMDMGFKVNILHLGPDMLNFVLNCDHSLVSFVCLKEPYHDSSLEHPGL